MCASSIPTFQLWRGGEKIEQYIAGKSVPAVPRELTALIDKHLPDFSLTQQVESTSVPAVGEGSSTKPAAASDDRQAAAAAAAAAAAEDETRPLINEDAMAKFRAAQAAKSMNVRRNPFAK